MLSVSVIGDVPVIARTIRPPVLVEVNHRLESRMRETRTFGSEGGGDEFNRLSLPLSSARFLHKSHELRSSQAMRMRLVVLAHAATRCCAFGAIF